MKKKYIITESQLKLLSEDLDGVMRGIAALMSVSIVGGGLWALAELLQRIGRRAEAGGHKERIFTRNEKETLLSAFNLAGGRISTRIPQLEKLKIKFDTFCPGQVAQVGTTNFEIDSAEYIIQAEPKNHLSSIIFFRGTNLDTNKKQNITLRSFGDDVAFQSIDLNAVANFGCSVNMVNLSNKKLYGHCVKDLKLNILDFPIHYKSDIKTDF